eukprot:14311927-Alexandrium_andersonii.AAC.1
MDCRGRAWVRGKGEERAGPQHRMSLWSARWGETTQAQGRHAQSLIHRNRHRPKLPKPANLTHTSKRNS